MKTIILPRLDCGLNSSVLAFASRLRHVLMIRSEVRIQITFHYRAEETARKTLSKQNVQSFCPVTLPPALLPAFIFISQL